VSPPGGDDAAAAGPLAEGARLVSRERRLTAADVRAFTALSGDSHPLHRDSALARESAWGEPIAPGLLLLCFSIGLVEIDQARVLALHRLREVVFVEPARFGATLRVDARVAEVRRVKPGVLLVGLRWLVREASGSVLVRAYLELLWAESA
jgi:acyl dehydratase